MSINMDSTPNRDVDYSSYEYQHVDFQTRLTGSDDSASSVASISVEPLEDRGGLDTNEVAELVSMYRWVHIELDGYGDNAPVNNGMIETRGSFGVDLDAETDLIGTDNLTQGETNILSTDDLTDEADATATANGSTNPAILDHWNVSAHAGWEDEVNNVAAGASMNRSERTVHLRKDLGAGPVLDSSDNIGPVIKLIKNNTELADVQVHYGVTMVWDIATVDDAGSRFGIPQND